MDSRLRGNDSGSAGMTVLSPWSRWSELNRRPTLYERVALPLSYIGLKRKTNQINF